MRLSLILAALLPLAACFGDETVRAYGAADKVWQLTELNGAPATAKTTLTFPEAGRIAGDAPCNSYFSAMEVPYPWFDAGPIGATKRACPELAAERAYFEALEKASLSEVLGDTLILSDDNGVLLVFKSSS
jgi:heat shock protein HslJ